MKRRCGRARCRRLFERGRSDQRFCSPKCGDAERKRIKRLVAKGLVPGRASARRGDGYEAFVAAGWPERLRSGEETLDEVADELGVNRVNVSRWMAAWMEDSLRERQQKGWSRSDEVEALLQPDPACFALFRSRYFQDEWGQPYVTEPYHLAWITALLAALSGGGRLMILSPPRHGKTQLLIHFAVWLIIRNPNIRIVWIGLNEENAKEAVGAVKDILENDERLVRDVLGPSGEFKPGARTGRSWTDGKFVTRTREGVGIKSPTMRAVGKGGKLLSKDADLIVADDIQDKEAYESPASRESDVRWMNTQVASRKEQHTALLVIGSRQHHEDLYGRLAANLQWQSIVETAHSFDCDLPVHSPRQDHDPTCPECAAHHDCLLWPAKRTMAYLQDQRVATDDDLQYEMVYLNRTRPSGEQYVTQQQIDECKNRSRTVGRWSGGQQIVYQPPDTRLIGGLDPAYAGMQASFLWAYNPTSKVRYAMDVDNRSAGSTAGARAVIKDWNELYGCKLWVIERNNFQGAILQDPDLKAYCNAEGIVLVPHFTDRFNKWDQKFGVPKQLEAFGTHLIDIPWGDEETQERFAAAIKQWVNWDPQNSHAKDDIVMAAWFPERHFLNWRREESNQIRRDYRSTGYFDSGSAGAYQRVSA